MILKMRATNDPNSNLCPMESWRYFEDVQGLHYSVYASEEHFRKENATWGLPSDVQEIWFAEQKPADGSILFLAFHSESLGAVHLFCNTQCYLMNDNGKTIEKLI